MYLSIEWIILYRVSLCVGVTNDMSIKLLSTIAPADNVMKVDSE